MQSFILEYSDGPQARRRAGSYPEHFRRLAARVEEAGLDVNQVLRLGTVSTPFRFLEVIEAERESAGDYAKVVQEVFGGPIRLRAAQQIPEDDGKSPRARAGADLVDRAGRDSFPASDTPSWSPGTAGPVAPTQRVAKASMPTIGLPDLEPFPPGCCP